MLEDDDDDEDWSSSYQPSAIEEVHSTRVPSTTFYCDQSDLQAFSPWQLGGSDSLLQSPFGKGDPSLPVDGTTMGHGFHPPLPQSYEEVRDHTFEPPPTFLPHLLLVITSGDPHYASPQMSQNPCWQSCGWWVSMFLWSSPRMYRVGLSWHSGSLSLSSCLH